MWLWESELRELGFRRKSEGYWRCERRYGLADGEYVSVFSWGEQTLPPAARGPARYVVELTEFHVTFLIGIGHVHFYYHEYGGGGGGGAGGRGAPAAAGGRRGRGRAPAPRRAGADRIAWGLVGGLGGVWRPRRAGPHDPPGADDE